MLKRVFQENKPLFFVIFLALFLRLFGISHGFPHIFHPDEPTVIQSALGIRFSPNSGHFDWPHLYIYLNYFLYMGFAFIRNIFELLHIKNLIASFAPIIWDEPLVFYLLTRTLSAILGGLTVLPVYLIGKKLFDKNVGLLASLALAIFPFHVSHSHYALTDVPMVFLVAWVAYFSASILKSPTLKNFLLAGFFVGIGASTKYNGGLSALVVAVAYFAHYLSDKDKFRKVVSNLYKPLLSAVSALVGFLLGTPYALLDYKTFSRTDGPKGAFWQFENVGSVSFAGQISQFFTSFVSKFPSDWSVAFVLLFITGFSYFIYRIFCKRIVKTEIQSLLLLFLPSLVFLFYISGFSKNRSHYYMIAYPFIALIIGWFCTEFLYKFAGKTRITFLIILFAFPFALSLSYSLSFARRDTRLLAADWYYANSLVLSKSNYTLYYDGDGLEKALPSFARKFSGEESSLVYPYILVSFCDSASDNLGETAFYTDAFLRRGDPVCIYMNQAEDK